MTTHRAFIEIIEKVKDDGTINAVLVDATVDADAPNCGFPMEHTEYKIKHSTPTRTFFTATAVAFSTWQVWG